MDETVERAIKAEWAQHPIGELERLAPRKRTELIYSEMQRIDVENSEASLLSDFNPESNK